MKVLTVRECCLQWLSDAIQEARPTKTPKELAERLFAITEEAGIPVEYSIAWIYMQPKEVEITPAHLARWAAMYRRTPRIGGAHAKTAGV